MSDQKNAAPASSNAIALPAATVVLLRAGSEAPEILLVERARSMGFAGGMYVFPGGKVDDGDLAIARNPKWTRGFEGLSDFGGLDLERRQVIADLTLHYNGW